jgi:hypothetical protein
VIEHSPYDTLEHLPRSWEWAIPQQDAKIVETDARNSSGGRHRAPDYDGILANRLVACDETNLVSDFHPEAIQR